MQFTFQLMQHCVVSIPNVHLRDFQRPLKELLLLLLHRDKQGGPEQIYRHCEKGLSIFSLMPVLEKSLYFLFVSLSVRATAVGIARLGRFEKTWALSSSD